MVSPSQSGVFSKAKEDSLVRFTESISFDRRLYAQDIAGSLAHTRMLAANGLISTEECQLLEDALLAIRREIEQDQFEFRAELEDIHMHIEQALIDRLGDVGRKLHTGRSRNDQVSTDFRLWIRQQIDEIQVEITQLQAAFVARCDADADIILPAYSHLQRAQPVLAPHYWMAYCEKLERDRGRLADCRSRVNVSPLGSAALAGTTLPIDRDDVAHQLGFESVAANSLDASSDRDFALEMAFALSTLALHLSGWAEEWILWSTAEFNFITLPEQYCTGSSIMPHKINPDVLELTRGKTARVLGNLQSLMCLMKGLPLAYNRDLQEDKPALFDSVDTVRNCLVLAEAIVRGSQLNREAIAQRLECGYLDATTLMEYLIRRGMPQRKAHNLVGLCVRKAREGNVRLADLTLDDFRQIDPDLDHGVFEVLGTRRAVEAFVSYGSTAPDQVQAQLQRWKDKLSVSSA